MCPDLLTFQYSSQAKILIHHGDRTDRKGRIDKKQETFESNVRVLLFEQNVTQKNRPKNRSWESRKHLIVNYRV